MKNKYLCFIIIIALFLSCTAVSSSADEPEVSDSSVQEVISGDDAVSYYDQAISIILSKYRFDAEKEDIYKATIDYILKNNPQLLEQVFTGMFDSLDDHSTYYTEEQMNSFINNMSGELCGIGVLVTTIDSGLLIMNIYNDTPAKETGLKIGDIITEVDGKSIAGLDISVAQSMVAGEENTDVNITVKRNEAIHHYTITRRRVIVDSGSYQIIPETTTGYILLNEFNDQAAEFVESALDEFDKSNIKNIIIDLRNNPGGSLTELVDVCSFFIPKGPAIHLDFKNPLRNYTLYSDNDAVRYNLIVLINENSASASEAFAGAIQDTGTGIVLGSKSYGKGTMQILTNFKIGGGIKLTEAVYLTPSGRMIDGVGITPDLFVEDKVTPYEKCDFEKITYDRVMRNGDTGKDVLAIEQRLYYLGFLESLPDETYDTDTYDATMTFQGVTDLYEYGVMDITTQLKLDSQLKGMEIINDRALKKATEIFSYEDWHNYKSDEYNQNEK